MKNIAAIVVNNDQYKRRGQGAQQGQTVQIKQRRGIPEQQGRRLFRVCLGDTGGRGDQAVNAGGTAVGIDMRGLNACASQHIQQPDRHAVPGKQDALQLMVQLMTQRDLAPLRQIACNQTGQFLLPGL